MELKLLTVFFTFFLCAHTIPVWQSSQCAQSCSQDPLFVNFSPQKTYIYTVDTRTSLALPNNEPQEVTLTAKLEFSQHENCEATLLLKEVSVPQFPELKSQLELFPLQFGFDDGRVVGVCQDPEDADWSVNIKKSLLSALQMSARSTMTSSVVRENDFLGTCDTSYTPITKKFSTIVMRKEKALATCDSRTRARVGLFPRSYDAPFIARRSLFNGTFSCEQTLDKDIIIEAQCSETQNFVTSSLRLRFLKSVNGLSSKRLSQFTTQSLLYASNPRAQQYDEFAVQELLRDACDKPISQMTSLVPRLVEAVRSASFSTLQRAFESITCDAVKDVFVDTLPMAASESAAKLIAHLTSNNVISSARADFLLTQMTFHATPTESIVRALIPLVEREDASRVTLLSVSSLAHNWCETRPCDNTQTLSQLVDAIARKRTSTPIDKIVLIKALTNIPHSKSRDSLISWSRDRDEGVRVAAIEAIRDEQTLLQTLKSESESTEVRIAAYKALVPPTSQTARDIESLLRSSRNKDLIAFISSHVRNWQSSHDPHKKFVKIQVPEKEVNSNVWTRNVEYSYVHDATNVGLVLDSDFIFDAHVPRAFQVNVTVPLFGHSLNVVSIKIRQKGLDTKFARALRNQQWTRVFDDIIAIFESSSRDSDAYAQMIINVDGKTLLVIDTRDNKYEWELLERARRAFTSGTTLDRAIALLLLDSEVTLPTINGWPLTFALNASLVAGLKLDAKMSNQVSRVHVAPSIGAQIGASLQLHFHRTRPGIAFVSRLSSEPELAFNIDVSQDGKKFDAKLNLPREKQTLFKLETHAHVRDVNGRVKDVLPRAKQSNGCTRSLHRPLGISFCADISRASLIPINAEFSLVKTDQSMKGYEISYDVSDLRALRIAFNTPQSNIDRESRLEFTSINNEIRATVKTPFAHAQVTGNDRSLVVEVSRDGARVFGLDVGVDVESRGRKMELRPRVSIAIGREQPVNVRGSVSLTKGKKNQLQIDLHDARGTRSKQFIKGSFVRESQGTGNEFKLSTDVSASVPFMDVRVYGVVERNIKQALLDLNVEYTKGRKETLKIGAKIQNLSSGQLTKMSALGEVTSSQWSKINTHVQYNLLKKPNEHLENELTINARDTKVHVLQISKLISTSTTKRMENTLITELGSSVNYEVRVNAESKRDALATYTIEFVGKDRNGQKQRDARASFVYKHVSRAPLQLAIDAEMRVHNNQWKYSDKLKEINSGEFQGTTEIEHNDKKLISVDYRYAIKSDARTFHHEIDAQIRTSNRRVPIAHSSLLKLSRDALEFKTRVDEHSLDALVSRAQQRLAVESGANFKTKFESSLPRSAEFELRANQLQHRSSLALDPQQYSFALKSDTKRDSLPVFAVDAQINKYPQPSTIVVNHALCDTRLHLDKNTINVDVKSPRFTHATVLTRNTLKSDTRANNKNLLSVDALARKDTGHLNLDCPIGSASFLHTPQRTTLEARSQKWEHSSAYSKPKFTSTTSRDKQRVLQVDYNYNNEHELQLDTPLWSSTLAGNSKRAAIDFKHKRSQYEHRSELRVQPQQWQLTSRTDKKGNSLLDLDATVSRTLYTPSTIKVKSRDITGNFMVDPKKAVKWTLVTPTIDHMTDASINNNQYKLFSRYNANSLDANFARDKSVVRVQVPNYQSSLTYAPNKEYQFTFDAQPYNHVTRLVPGQQWSLESRTDHALDGRVLHVNAQPSIVNVKYLNDVNAQLKYDPRKVSFNARDADRWSHDSHVAWDDATIALRSKTESRGKNALKLDSLLARDKLSHVTVASQYYGSAHAEYDPLRRAKFELRAHPYEHNSELTFGNEWRLESNTARDKRPLATITATKTQLHVQSQPLTTSLVYDPRTRGGKFDLKTALIDHSSHVRVEPRSWIVKSNTNYNKQLLAKLDSEFARDQQSVALEIPHYSTRVDLSRDDGAKVDFRSRQRHVLASAAMRDGAQFELAWDVDRDPNKKLRVSVTNNGRVYQLNGEVLKRTFSAKATMADDLINGPHDVYAEYRHDANSVEVSAHHVISNNKLDCRVSVSRDNTRFFQLESTATFYPVAAQLHVLYKKNDAKITFNHRNAYNDRDGTELRAIVNNKVYSARIFGKDKKLGEIEWNGARAETTMSWDDGTITGVVTRNNKRLMEFDARATQNSIAGELKSQIKNVPSLALHAQKTPDSVHVTFDRNAERALEARVFITRRKLEVHWETNGVTPTFDITASAERTRNSLNYELSIKKDSVDILTALVTGTRSSGAWNGDATISTSGAPFASLKLTSDVINDDEAKYLLNGRYRDHVPIKVTWSHVARSNKDFQFKAEVCARECGELSVVAKKTNAQIFYEAAISKSGREARATYQWSRDGNSKLELSVNGARAGYELIQGNDRVSAKLLLPSRVIRADAKWTRDTWRATIDNDKKSVTLEVNTANGIDIQVTSPQWKRPKHVQIRTHPIRVIVDVARDEMHALHLDVDAARGSNSTLTVAFYTRDRRTLDFHAQSHVALDDVSDWSIGVQWSDLTRHGVKKGFYLIRGGRGQWEFWRHDPIEKYHVTGQYTRTNNQFSSQWTLVKNGEETRVHFKITDKCAELQVADAYDRPQRKYAACVDTTNQRIFSLNADSYDGDDHVTDASLILDARPPKTLKLHAHWDPNAIGQFLVSLADHKSTLMTDLIDELTHKSQQLTQHVTQHALVPIATIAGDELNALFEEFAESYSPIISDYFQEWKRHARKTLTFVQPAFDIVARAYYYWSDAIDTFNSRLYQWTDVITEQLYSGLKHVLTRAQRIVFSIEGRVRQMKFPRIELPQRVYDVVDYVSDVVARYIEKNDDLKAIAKEVRVLIKELQLEFTRVDWTRVRQFALDLFDILFSSSSWKRSNRVLLYDPQKGELQLELHAPIHPQRLQLAFNKHETSARQLVDKISAWWKQRRHVISN